MTGEKGRGTPRLVVANRGEIAVRIIKTAKTMGWDVAVVAPSTDQNTLACRRADHVLTVPDYLNGGALVAAAREWGAGFVHPGYGFLSENPAFGALVEEKGMVFVGPTPTSMAQLGHKERAKELARAVGVPVAPTLGSAELQGAPPSQWPALLQQAGIEPPYLVKASGGGGGRGMRVVETAPGLAPAVERASQEALAAFGDGHVFIEPYFAKVRHVEAQIFGDGAGGGVFLGERECSLQRRHQKIVEESPSVAVDGTLREQLGRAALALVAATQYRGAGTIEFLLTESGTFFFLEMNTRLQVEHPVTEMVTGLDLVACQLQLAQGVWPTALGNPKEWHMPRTQGHALEVRLTAEDPSQNFLPTPGALDVCRFPQDIPRCLRVDTGVEAGDRVSGSYDPMVAKIIVWGPTRNDTLAKARDALEKTLLGPCLTNQSFLLALLESIDFMAGDFDTGWLEGHLTQILAAREGHSQWAFFQEWLVNGGGARGGRALVAPPPLAPIFKRLGASSGLGSPVSVANAEQGLVANTSSQMPCFALFPIQQGKKLLLVHSRGHAVAPNPWDEDYAKGGDSLAGALETICAPMAGKVVAFHGAVGEVIEAGHVLCVFESMKIQMEIKSQVGGTLQDVFVAPGQVLGGPEPLAVVKRG